VTIKIEKITFNSRYLRVKEWPNEYLVYHLGTGDTHLLNKSAAEVFFQLQRGVQDLESLKRSLSINSDSGEAKLISTIRQFQNLSFVDY